MHYRLKAMAVVLITCPALTPVCAQFADSTGKVIPAIDTVPRKINWSTPVPIECIPIEIVHYSGRSYRVWSNLPGVS